MVDFLWLVIALPLFGAVVLLLFGKRLGEPTAGRIGTLMVATSFLIAVIAALPAFGGDMQAETVYLFELIPSLGVNFSLLWDPLSGMMTLMITGFGDLVHIYVAVCMTGDKRF